MQPKVLLACDFFLRYTSMLAGGLARTGAEVGLLTRAHDMEFGGRDGAAEAFVERAAGPATKRYVVPGRVRSVGGWRRAVGTRRAIRRFAPDYVHLQAAIGNDVRLILASGARPRRFALTVHDPVRHPGDDVSRSAATGNRALIRTAGLIFVHAEALRDELREVTGARAPIVVVPHGVDPGGAEPLPKRPSILVFGRLRDYKGVDVVLDSMARVWEKVPGATLTIAGQGELADHPVLRDSRVTARLEHVPDEEVSALFAAATCVALPYRQASQSGVGSLAKRHARPLVVSEVGGLPELVADDSGLVVPPGDSTALATALVSVLSDRSLAERLSAAAGRTAAGAADWGRVGELTLRAYRDHLPTPGRGR